MTDDLPVVLVHGIRTSATMWRAQVAALEAAGRRVVAVDLPGHGRRADEPFTLDAARGVLDDAVEQVGGQVLLAGLSLGGYLAVDWTARNPAAVRGLVAAACCTVPQVPLRGAWVRLSRWIERTPDSGAALNAAMVRTFLPAQGVADIGAGGFVLSVMSGALEEIGALDPLADLRALRCPLWLVNGRYDHFRTQERAYLAAARSSGQPVHRVLVPRARHLVSLDAPVAFSRVLLEALDTVDPVAPPARAGGTSLGRAGAAPHASPAGPSGAVAREHPGVASAEQVPGAGPADERR